MGVLIAQSLSGRYSLQQLAHLKGPVLREAAVQELKRLAATAG
jgi:hypothetical protein